MWEKILKTFIKEEIKRLSEIQKDKRIQGFTKQGSTSSILTTYYSKLNEMKGKANHHWYRKNRWEYKIQEKIPYKTYALTFCDWRYQIRETTHVSEKTIFLIDTHYQSWMYVIALGSKEELEIKLSEIEASYQDKINDYESAIKETREYEEKRRNIYQEKEAAYLLFEQEWKEKTKPFDNEYEAKRKISAKAFTEMKIACENSLKEIKG